MATKKRIKLRPQVISKPKRTAQRESLENLLPLTSPREALAQDAGKRLICEPYAIGTPHGVRSVIYIEDPVRNPLDPSSFRVRVTCEENSLVITFPDDTRVTRDGDETDDLSRALILPHYWRHKILMVTRHRNAPAIGSPLDKEDWGDVVFLNGVSIRYESLWEEDHNLAEVSYLERVTIRKMVSETVRKEIAPIVKDAERGRKIDNTCKDNAAKGAKERWERSTKPTREENRTAFKALPILKPKGGKRRRQLVIVREKGVTLRTVERHTSDLP